MNIYKQFFILFLKPLNKFTKKQSIERNKFKAYEKVPLAVPKSFGGNNERRTCAASYGPWQCADCEQVESKQKS